MKSSESLTRDSNSINIDSWYKRELEILNILKEKIDNKEIYKNLIEHCLLIGKNNVYSNYIDKIIKEIYPQLYDQHDAIAIYQSLHSFIRLICFEDKGVDLSCDISEMDIIRESLEQYAITYLHQELHPDQLIGDIVNE